MLQDPKDIFGHIVEREFKDDYKGTILEFGCYGIDDANIDFDMEDMLRHVEPEVLTGAPRKEMEEMGVRTATDVQLPAAHSSSMEQRRRKGGVVSS
uniref:Uncharacterized protein n=1 Tax=Oryza sativa subsp. japonica TaxID=39947 RepID=Q6ES07_ORYSJ|nr:hypothetical protein [Oryza sativa Japonica Group]BAD28563.1 hypothetical protein [Oryza sativa Japonica Group]